MFLALSIACLAAAVLTLAIVEYLRRRSFLKHRASGDAPPAQHLVIRGLLISGPLELASFIFLVIWLIQRGR